MDDRFENDPSILAAEYGFRCPFRMGHHPQDVAPLVHEAGDAVHGSVDICSLCELAIGFAIPEDDLVVLLDRVQSFRFREIVAVEVGDGNFEHISFLGSVRERSVGILCSQMDMLTEKFEVFVPEHRTWEELQLEEDLEAITDP